MPRVRETERERANSDEPSETSKEPALECRAEPRPFASGRHGLHGDAALFGGLVPSAAATALHHGQMAGWRAEPAYESKPHPMHTHRNNNTAIMKSIIKVHKM